MLKKEIKYNVQLQEEFDKAVKDFNEKHPNLHENRRDNEVTSCILLMINKYKQIFPNAKDSKKEKITDSVNALSEFVTKYLPKITYGVFSEKEEYAKARKALLKKGENLLKDEIKQHKAGLKKEPKIIQR